MGVASGTANFFKEKMGLGGFITAGTTLWGGFSQYESSRDEGHGVITSLAAAGADAALSAVMGWKSYLGMTALPALGQAGIDLAYAASQYTRDLQRDSLNIPFATSTFIDSPQVQTMRQAGLALARQSKMKTQEAMLGNEASYMHR